MSESAPAAANDLGLPIGRPLKESHPRARRGSRPKTNVGSAAEPAAPLPSANDGELLGEQSVAGPRNGRVAGGDGDTCSGKSTGSGPTEARDGQEKRKASPAQIAANLRDGPTILALRALGVGRDLPVHAWQIFLADLFQRAGNPADPIERVLVRQLALADQAVANLYLRAATADDPAMSRTCFDALAKLLEEIPRLALAIREYRGAASKKIVDIVGHPSRAPAGDQQTTDLERRTGA